MDASTIAQGVARDADVYPINSAASSVTVYTPISGTFFLIWQLFIQAEDVTELTFKSGSTSISGPINFAANAEHEFSNAPFPVFAGRLPGEAFVIANSASKQLNGWALISGGA